MPSFYSAYKAQRSGTFRVLLLVPLAFAEHYDAGEQKRGERPQYRASKNGQ